MSPPGQEGENIVRIVSHDGSGSPPPDLSPDDAKKRDRQRIVRTPFKIVIDSREQAPLSFGSWPTVVAGLPTGDYSLQGFEDRVAIERKSLADLFACVGRERARFERELARLAAMEYGALVVEATLEEILAGCPRSAVSPRAAVGSLIAWSVEHRLPVFFAGSRRLAAAVVLKALSKFWKYRVAEPAGLRGRSKL